jgi:hypothetical protein
MLPNIKKHSSKLANSWENAAQICHAGANEDFGSIMIEEMLRECRWCLCFTVFFLHQTEYKNPNQSCWF